MTKQQCTDHTVTIEDKEDEGGTEISRWECSACGRHGHWTPTIERQLVAVRGHAHTLRSRKPRPNKRAAPAALREVLTLNW